MAGYNILRHASSPIRAYAPKPSSSDIHKLQLEDTDWIKAQLDDYQPSLILYCHAVCDVDECEKKPDWAENLNVRHVERLLSVLPSDVRVMYVSSDHVFGGDGIYTEVDSTCPISIYGRTRCQAEELISTHANSLIIRHSLIIGPSHNQRSGHLDWMRHRAKTGLPMTIIHDESRSAIMADHFAERALGLAQSGITGLRHITSDACPSRPELADHLSKGSFTFEYASRHDQPYPHLGKVTLESVCNDPLSTPLPSPMHTTPGLALEG